MSSFDEIEALLNQVKSPKLSTEEIELIEDGSDGIVRDPVSMSDDLGVLEEGDDLIIDVDPSKPEVSDLDEDDMAVINHIKHENLDGTYTLKPSKKIIKKIADAIDTIVLREHVESNEVIDRDIVMEGFAAMFPKDIAVLKAKMTQYPSEANKNLLDSVMKEIADEVPADLLKSLRGFMEHVEQGGFKEGDIDESMQPVYSGIDNSLSIINEICEVTKNIPIYVKNLDGFVNLLDTGLGYLSNYDLSEMNFAAYDDVLPSALKEVVEKLGSSSLTKELPPTTGGTYSTVRELGEQLNTYKGELTRVATCVVERYNMIASYIDNDASALNKVEVLESIGESYDSLNKLIVAKAIEKTGVYDDIRKLLNIIRQGV